MNIIHDITDCITDRVDELCVLIQSLKYMNTFVEKLRQTKEANIFNIIRRSILCRTIILLRANFENSASNKKNIATLIKAIEESEKLTKEGKERCNILKNEYQNLTHDLGDLIESRNSIAHGDLQKDGSLLEEVIGLGKLEDLNEKTRYFVDELLILTRSSQQDCTEGIELTNSFWKKLSSGDYN